MVAPRYFRTYTWTCTWVHRIKERHNRMADHHYDNRGRYIGSTYTTEEVVERTKTTLGGMGGGVLIAGIIGLVVFFIIIGGRLIRSVPVSLSHRQRISMEIPSILSAVNRTLENMEPDQEMGLFYARYEDVGATLVEYQEQHIKSIHRDLTIDRIRIGQYCTQDSNSECTLPYSSDWNTEACVYLDLHGQETVNYSDSRPPTTAQLNGTISIAMSNIRGVSWWVLGGWSAGTLLDCDRSNLLRPLAEARHYSKGKPSLFWQLWYKSTGK